MFKIESAPYDRPILLEVARGPGSSVIPAFARFGFEFDDFGEFAPNELFFFDLNNGELIEHPALGWYELPSKFHDLIVYRCFERYSGHPIAEQIAQYKQRLYLEKLSNSNLLWEVYGTVEKIAISYKEIFDDRFVLGVLKSDARVESQLS